MAESKKPSTAGMYVVRGGRKVSKEGSETVEVDWVLEIPRALAKDLLAMTKELGKVAEIAAKAKKESE